jgi:hypothetical protein
VLFNSFAFLYVFLPVTYLVFWRLRGRDSRYVWLAVTGYVFYAFWNPKFCALMALSTVVSYLAGLGFLRWQDPMRRRLCLLVPVAVDLSLHRWWDWLCADPLVTKRHLCAGQLPPDQQSLRPDRGKLRIPGNRWAVVPHSGRSGPVAHLRIPLLWRTGQ